MSLKKNCLEIKDLIFKWNNENNFELNIKSFNLKDKSKTLLLGSSGSGKSTFLNLIGGIINPISGTININNINIFDLSSSQKDFFRALNLGVIFQQFNLIDYISPISNILLPCYFTSFKDKSFKYYFNRAISLAEKLGIDKDTLTKSKSKNLSVGQKQRIAIIRSIINKPKLILADEPTSALDVSVQANTLNLLKDLQDELGLTMLFISHDLPVIRQMCDRVAVMRHGQICEITDTESFFNSASHEYSKHLINLMPEMSF